MFLPGDPSISEPRPKVNTPPDGVRASSPSARQLGVWQRSEGIRVEKGLATSAGSVRAIRVAWNDLAEGFILLDSHTAQFKPQVEPWPDAGKFESHDRLEGLFFQALARLMITRETESEHEAALATALWMLMHGHCGKTRIGWRCMPAFDWGSAAPHWSNTGAVRRLCREGWARRQCSGPPSSAASSCREARRSNAGVSLRRSDTSNRARCAPWAQSARRDRTRQAGGQGEGTGALPQVLARRAGEGGQTSAHQPCGRGGQNPSG